MTALRRPLLRAALMLGLFVLTTLGLGEVVVRGLRVEPRVVMIREDPRVVHLSTLSGRVVWEQVERRAPGAPTRQNLGCADRPTHRVHLYGDSIAFGSDLTVEESPGAQLQAALVARGTGAPWCVQNFAQPGATPWVARAFADAHLPSSRPELVLIELWYGGNHVPLRAGDVVYYPTGMRTDADGYPTFAFGWTGWLHHALFDASRFWAWSTFVVSPRCDTCEPTWESLLDGDIQAMRAGAAAVGADTVLLVAAPLDVPFAETLAHPPEWTVAINRWAARERVPVLHVADLLSDQAVEAVRLDPCCHLNPTGARLLGQRVVERLAGPIAAIEARPATAAPGPAAP